MLRFSRIAVVAAVVGAGCGTAPVSRDQPPALDNLLTLVRARDYFTLRDRLGTRGLDESAEILFARSLERQAFNDLAGSNASIAAARARGGLSDSLQFRLQSLEARNLFRLFRYRDGLAVAEAALAKPPLVTPAAEVDDLRNLRKILNALATVPPQEVVHRDSATVKLKDGLIAVRVGETTRDYIFDTGANLSTMARSEAGALGLTVLKAGIDVGSSSDIRNQADLAVAGRLSIGGLEFRNVVFLVFDDRLLTFPGGRIRGIVGFPVIDAMGEVRLRASGELRVPRSPPARSVHNLALDGQTPLTTIRWGNESSVCRLDTGANASDIYEPFYRRHRGWVDSAGHPDSAQSGGVGGIRTLPIRTVTALSVGVGDTTFTWSKIGVITRSLAKTEADNYLFCNLGHDVLDHFSEYIINFRDMSFLLR